MLTATAGSALAAVHYVDVNSTNATPPYTNWATAVTNIQVAVDAAAAGDGMIDERAVAEFARELSESLGTAAAADAAANGVGDTGAASGAGVPA